jgi:PPP family 3-phenylpropionic acid transporter
MSWRAILEYLMLAPPSLVNRDDAPRFFALRAVLLFCAPMLVNGIAVLYFPVLLQDLRMTPAEIGIITSIPALMRILGMPVGSMAADRAKDRTTVLMWSGIVSLATTLVMFHTVTFWPILLVYAVQSLFYAPYVPIADAVLVTGVRRWGFDYGSLRLWGSIAFALTTFIGFGLDRFGGAMVLPGFTLFFSLTIIMALIAPRLGRDVPSAPSDPAVAIVQARFWAPDFLLVIIGASVVMSSQSMLYAFATNYWKAQGISGVAISFLWLAGVLAEICLFFVSGRWLRRFSVWRLFILGSAFTFIRWTLFPLVDGFWPFFLLQCTHAFTYAMMHLGVQRFMITRVGDRQGAYAQGFYQAATSIFAVISGWASGYIFQAFGVDGFYSMSILVVIGVAILCVARLIQPQSARSGG